jgi:zeta-carotene desaturase
MWRLGPGGRLSVASRTFDSLLDEWKQGRRVRELFWEPVIVGACNLAMDEVAAVHGLQVFQDGFLAGRWQATMGVPAIPLETLYEPAIRLIEAGGGEVRFGCSATRLALERRRAIGVETQTQFVRGHAVLSALPWERLDAIIGDRERDLDSRLRELPGLGHSPILGVHLIFDRAVMGEPHLVLPGKAVHWLFNKGTAEDGTQHIHAVISAADAWMDLKEPEIRRRVVQDVSAAYPEASDAHIVQCRPVKERRATFRATPHAELLRPMAAPNPVGPHGGDIEGLYLAGDWCATGWPATMEGAVRSGYAAAAAIAAQPRTQ